MKLSSVLMALAVMITPAMAQQATPEAKVDFTMKADMQALKDPKGIDHFEIVLQDSQLRTKLLFDCTAGRNEYFGLTSQPKTCTFPSGGKSAGSLAAPGGKWLPRTQFSGYFEVAADGTTPAKTLAITYLPVGQVPAGQATFEGQMKLKPNVTSKEAATLQDRILQKIQGESTSPINKAVDTIDLNNFCMPSMGRPSDKGVCFTGNLVFPYQTYSWFQKLTATFNDKTYEFTGNMPYIDSVDADGKAITKQGYDSVTEYNVTLTLPAASLQGDDALFADATGDDSLFAAVDGINCKITMDNKDLTPVKVQGEDDEVPVGIDATGSCIGTNIPLEVVRGYLTFIALNPTTFFGP